MSHILNCEGEACPNPVLRCKHLLDEKSPQKLTVIVDNVAAKENVSRFLTSRKMQVDDVREEGRLWHITASRLGDATANEPLSDAVWPTNADLSCPPHTPKILVFLTTASMGHGDESLGERLMQNFLNTLPELGDSLWRIIMVNGAVKLSTGMNPALETLKNLEKAGVSILVCGTCLEFFRLLDQKQIGQVTNMLDVVTSQQVADKVITI